MNINKIADKIKGLIPDAYALKVSSMLLMGMMAISPIANQGAAMHMHNQISDAKTNSEVMLKASEIENDIGFNLMKGLGKPFELAKNHILSSLDKGFTQNDSGTFNSTVDGEISQKISELEYQNPYQGM